MSDKLNTKQFILSSVKGKVEEMQKTIVKTAIIITKKKCATCNGGKRK